MAVQGSAVLSVSDYKDLIRKLNKLESGLGTAFKRNLKKLAEGPRAAVRSAIPQKPPLSGMRRVLSPVSKTWNTKNNARTVIIKTGTKSTRPTLNTKPLGIIKLVIPSPATVIADMAGRGNVRTPSGTKTEYYVYPRAKDKVRRHTVTTQGNTMIEKLGGGPSRYAYPAAEEAMPDFVDQVEELISYVTGEIERG